MGQYVEQDKAIYRFIFRAGHPLPLDQSKNNRILL